MHQDGRTIICYFSYQEENANPANFCPQTNTLNFDRLLKQHDLDSFRLACR